jgi:hypothetical protein
VAVVDAEQVRAAVTVALDASMDAMAEEITRRVLAALQTKKPEVKGESAAPLSANLAAPPAPVRRVSPLRIRSSILGLEVGPSDSE